MARKERIELINNIEKLTGFKIITYITGDRQPFGSKIGEDAVRPMYEHIRTMNNNGSDKVGLFIYSRGGSTIVPWRIISMLRENFKEVNVLIPYKSHSAATMLAMGADNLYLGKKAELGPIDPTLERVIHGPEGIQSGPPQEISVEDVFSYISFIRDCAKITDQQALAEVIKPFCENIEPLALGRVNREHSHIRLVAKKLLSSHNKKLDEERMNTIIEALTEKIYSHGHAIGRREVNELRLPTAEMSSELEEAMWNLYIEYEDMLELNNPIDFEMLLRQSNQPIDMKELQDLICATIESNNKSHEFLLNVMINRNRAIPQNLQMNLNLNIGLPPTINIQQMPPESQQQIQQLVQQLLQQIQRALPSLVQNEIARQSQTRGFSARGFNGRWVEKKDGGQ